jgi:D-glycero-D-manno-heptose 1,7-bisphosphate phosphatase
MKRKQFPGAVFLDRDGVINVDRRDYVKSWSEFKFLPGVFKALRLLKKNGIPVIIVTNQSAVNRGLMTLDTLLEIHEKMLHAIRTHGGEVEAIYYCPHTPEENCECRKPKSGMVRKAAKDLKINLSVSYLVGDSEKDTQLARSVKVKGVKIVEETVSQLASEPLDWTRRKPTLATSLREAVDVILRDLKNSARP